MKETLDDFLDRIMHVYGKYPRPDYYLVWKSEKLRKSVTIFKPKPERWDIPTIDRYIQILSKQELKVYV